MKRAILTLLVAAALVGCKRDYAPEPNPATVPEDVIQLATGMQTSIIQDGRNTKTGVRDEKGFKLGDHIGVSAIYSKDKIGGTTGPDLSIARWFVNKPATAEAAIGTPSGAPTSWYNPFHWGEGETSIPSDGASVAGDYQFYPQGRYIFLYAYYPFATGNDVVANPKANGVEFVSGVIASDNTATNDKIKVTLQPETLDVTSLTPQTALALKQPDVMVGANAKRTGGTIAAINRTSLIADAQLDFKHVLAQLRLQIRKTDEVKEAAVLQKVEISWPKSATYLIGEEATAPDDLPSATGDAGKKVYADADLVKHTITCNITIPKGAATAAADILGATNKEMLMLHPLTQAQLDGCIIKITVKFESIELPKEFTISLTSLADGIVQGACNKVNFLVNYVKIDVTGDIAEWATDGEDGDMNID